MIVALRRLVLPCLAATQCVEPNPNITASGSASESDGGGSGTNDSTGDPTSTGTTPTTTSDHTQDPSMDPSSDPTQGQDTTSVGDGECPPDRVCVPPAPSGWSGPGVLAQQAERDEPVACPPGFDDGPAVVAHDGLVAGPAECSCSCEPLDADCSGAVEFGVSGTAGCNPSQDRSAPHNGTCLDADTWDDDYYFADTPIVDVGACLAKPSSMTPPAMFSTRASLCAASSSDAAACEGDHLCTSLAPAPFGDASCVWTDGVVDCPLGSEYSARSVLHRDIDDSRGCTACSCGEIDGTCDATIELRSGDACSGSVLGEIVSGAGCGQVEGTVNSYRLVELVVNGVCAPATGGQPAGSATPADPLTVCCLEG